MKSTTLGLLVLFLLSIGAAEATPIAKSEDSRKYLCSIDSTQESVALLVTARGNAFDVSAATSNARIFDRTTLRPSLNVRIADEENDVINEFVDFNESGLEVIPVDGKNKLEFDLTPGATFVHYADAEKALMLNCSINTKNLLAFLDITPQSEIDIEGVKAVAFDIDDTLMFTSPAFTRGFATGGLPKPNDVLFWTHTNGCDPGCQESTITLSDGSQRVLPKNVPSTPKAKALELIRYHKSLGHKVYAITARPDINGNPLRDYLESQMGIAREDVFFEPDLEQPGNPSGKTDRIESLDLDVFYGDSDSDITDAEKAFTDGSGKKTKLVRPIRFLRSPKSSNRKAAELNKYHPGYFGEPILADSY